MADSEKIENVLNLSSDVPESERSKSAILQSGYQPVTKTWEVIVKYNGSLDKLTGAGITVEYLLAGYAILTVPEELLDDLANQPEIEFIEKSKNLYFGIEQAKEISCINQVTLRDPFLTGAGVLIAVIDTGLEYQRSDFRNPDGSTRILALWDQTIAPDVEKGWYPPAGFEVGTEFSEKMINEALGLGQYNSETLYENTQDEITEGNPEERMELNPIASDNGNPNAFKEGNTNDVISGNLNGGISGNILTGQGIKVPSVDISGHGTAVTAICAGSVGETYSGVATGSKLLIVKLGNTRSLDISPVETGFPKTTELMRAVTYCVRKAQQLNTPLAINISFGNTYGDHYGNTLLERFLDNAAEIGRTVICVGSGNEAASGGHYTGVVTQGRTSDVELSVAFYERSLSIQLWKNYADRYSVVIESPTGESVTITDNQTGSLRFRMGNSILLCYIGSPQPYSVWQEFFFELIPEGDFIDSGVWIFHISGERVVTGEFSLYLTSQAVRNAATRFIRPTPQVTLTIPSTSEKVITVGAYDERFDSYADFSGRGYVFRQSNQSAPAVTITKPDLVAPGVNILTVSVMGGYQLVSGTSFATPFVTGAAALLMEWGIIRGNDPYLYGEKVKAYLIRGARQILDAAGTVSGERPNPQSGWGALCVADSLPI